MYNVLKSLFLLALLSVLAACSNIAPQLSGSQPSDFEVASVATVAIETTDTEDAVAAKYGAKVIAFKPEVGFAILGFPKGQMSALTTTSNQDFFASPEVQAAGGKAWGGGKGAWGGGLKAWASGKGAWGGGTTAPTPPSENSAVWNQINLYEANQIAKNFGAGVKVAVIDTGLDVTHPIFQGNLAPSSEWKDFVDNDTNPQEGGVATDLGYGHGTAVAGIILQLAPRAIILPIRVLDKDSKGDLDDVIAAIDWAIQKGATVINLSLGTTGSSSALTQMIQYAASKSVYVVASSGNEGATTILSPASFAASLPYVVSVGSMNSTGCRSSFSNYSGALTVVAPGEQVYTAFPNNTMVQATGTSFAAPMVSGMLALGYSDSSSYNRIYLKHFLQDAAWLFTPSNCTGSTYGKVTVKGFLEMAR
jgi:thermitase